MHEDNPKDQGRRGGYQHATTSGLAWYTLDKTWGHREDMIDGLWPVSDLNVLDGTFRV